MNAPKRTVRIEIPGEPVAKGRPRVMRNGIAYTPEKTRKWEANAQLFAQLAMKGKTMLTGAIGLFATAYFAIPSWWPKWRKAEAEAGGVWHISRPDGDNIAKLVSDAFNGIVYADDGQICAMSVHKLYAADPRVEVLVTEVSGLTSKSSMKEMKDMVSGGAERPCEALALRMSAFGVGGSENRATTDTSASGCDVRRVAVARTTGTVTVRTVPSPAELFDDVNTTWTTGRMIDENAYPGRDRSGRDTQRAESYNAFPGR